MRRGRAALRARGGRRRVSVALPRGRRPALGRRGHAARRRAPRAERRRRRRPRAGQRHGSARRRRRRRLQPRRAVARIAAQLHAGRDRLAEHGGALVRARALYLPRHRLDLRRLLRPRAREDLRRAPALGRRRRRDVPRGRLVGPRGASRDAVARRARAAARAPDRPPTRARKRHAGRRIAISPSTPRVPSNSDTADAARARAPLAAPSLTRRSPCPRAAPAQLFTSLSDTFAESSGVGLGTIVGSAMFNLLVRFSHPRPTRRRDDRRDTHSERIDSTPLLPPPPPVRRALASLASRSSSRSRRSPRRRGRRRTPRATATPRRARRRAPQRRRSRSTGGRSRATRRSTSAASCCSASACSTARSTWARPLSWSAGASHAPARRSRLVVGGGEGGGTNAGRCRRRSSSVQSSLSSLPHHCLVARWCRVAESRSFAPCADCRVLRLVGVVAVCAPGGGGRGGWLAGALLGAGTWRTSSS